MPAAEPASPALQALDDDEVERRAAEDPDAGSIPPGFWDAARAEGAEAGEPITLRLDADVLRHFRDTGKGYRARMSAVLRDYVRAADKAR